MPVITAGIAGSTTVAGLSTTAKHVLEADLADDVAVYGLPATVLTPPPTVQATPDMVRARVLDSSGTFICHLPHAQGLRWLDEHNTAGAGSIDVRRYDDVETAHPGVWAAGNHVVVSVGSTDVFRLILDADAGYRLDEATGERVDAWAGPGALGILNSGECLPEYLAAGYVPRAESTEERTFDYGSDPTKGGWLVSREWKTPVGKLVRQSWRWTYKKRHQPKGWPEKKAQWIWWKNPDATSGVDETCYFRSSFTLSSPTRVKFWVAGDDTLEFQVDGEVRVTTGPGGWRKASTVVLHLSAGTHYVAAKVANTPSSGGNQNRSGFLCAIGKLNGDGDVTSWLRRSNTTAWTVRRQLTSPPGWFAGQILRQLVSEQITRGCAGHSGITLGFGTATDSAGVAWAGRQELSISVGTPALDYVQQLVEAGLDVAMTPSLRLNAWRSRGADRSSYIRLDQGTARALEEAASQLPAIKNVVYAKAASGWVVRSDSTSVAARGRRESMASFGGSRSTTQTSRALTQMLPDLADPPQTIEVKLSGATGTWQPYRDFNVGDWVSYKPAGATTWGRFQVMSIAGEVNDAGHPDWTLQLYEG
jgi:hypothetical protein